MTIKAAVNSVLSQKYPRFTVWIYDDGSDQPGATEMLENLCSPKFGVSTHTVHNFDVADIVDDRNHVKWALLEYQVSETSSKEMFCVRAREHLGPAGGKYWSFRLVHAKAEPNDVVLVLDGDDELIGSNALSIVNQAHIDNGAWFTYGTYEGRWSEQIKDIPADIRSGKQQFQPRHQTWLYGHPRTFRAHLLDYVSRTEFTFSDGSWLKKGTDRGFVYKMLELSGVDRVGYIPNKIYKYKFSNTSSTFAKIPGSIRESHVKHAINLPASTRLDLPVHVILLVWKRLHLLPYQLVWLSDQIELDGRYIELHLVVNNVDAMETVKSIVQNFTRQYTNYSNPLASVKFNVVNPDDNLHHNFQRFVYVQNLRRLQPLDNVIFLDDDQYWPPNFLSSLLKDYKPKGMTTWYGKQFQANFLSSLLLKDHILKGLATWYAWQFRGSRKNISYADSTFLYKDILDGGKWPAVSIFKYGGAGGSIYDTNLWLLDSQLMRLAGDLSRWSKIDDLWASYVLDALLGWELRRLTPGSVPVDIGKTGAYFSKQELYIHENHKKVVLELMVNSGQDTQAVATYLDPGVNKETMFCELQRCFHWDILT